MKSIANIIHHKDFPLRIHNDKGNEIYYGTSHGYSCTSKFDDQGNEIYFENSHGFWAKYEFDPKGHRIYIENSDGVIRDDRE